jgi:hypothetical protein
MQSKPKQLPQQIQTNATTNAKNCHNKSKQMQTNATTNANKCHNKCKQMPQQMHTNAATNAKKCHDVRQMQTNAEFCVRKWMKHM